MTDKEFIMDVLSTEKEIVTNTAYALNEASCDTIYNEFFEIFTDVSNNAKNLFTLAFNLGFYQLEEEKETKIKDAIKTLTQELQNATEEE